MIEFAREEVIKARAQLADVDLLSRCLVGHFSSKGDAPTRSDVRDGRTKPANELRES